MASASFLRAAFEQVAPAGPGASLPPPQAPHTFHLHEPTNAFDSLGRFSLGLSHMSPCPLFQGLECLLDMSSRGGCQ